jgi:hypothetical protein
VLIAVLACALSGCWEEIHYSPPPASSDVAKAAPQSDESQQNFADDVAESLDATQSSQSPGETTSVIGRPAETPATASPTPLPNTPGTPAAEESAADATPPANPARGPRRMAWLLGSNLSLAALANDRAASEDKVTDWFDKSQRLAALLNTTLAPLPSRPTTDQIDPAANRAMDYLFEQGQAIGRHLATQYGDDHAALFELALKSNILLVRYQPEAPVAKALSAAISQAGERAKLPADLYQPLLKLLDENAPAKDVRNAVFDMHAQCDRYLSTAQP